MLTMQKPYNIICLASRMKSDIKRGVAQLGQSAWFGTRRSQVRILSPRFFMQDLRVQFNGRTPAFQAGYVGSIPITRLAFYDCHLLQEQRCPIMKEAHQRVQMCVRSSAGQSNGLLSRGSGVRIPLGTFFSGINPGRAMVGIAQLVSAPDCGSGGRGFESHYPP